jgi:hypothetical protein
LPFDADSEHNVSYPDLVTVTKTEGMAHLLFIQESAGSAPKVLNHDALVSTEDPAVTPAHSQVTQKQVSLSGATDEERGEFFSLTYWNHFPVPIKNNDEG